MCWTTVTDIADDGCNSVHKQTRSQGIFSRKSKIDIKYFLRCDNYMSIIITM